jgi:hypothetical protein
MKLPPPRTLLIPTIQTKTMLEITTHKLAVKPLETMSVASKPHDNIFRSFNALNPKVFDDLLSNLRGVVRGDISEHITISDDSNRFYSNYQEHSSSRESKQEFSTSVGLEGKYGVFSASANFDYTRVEASSFTALYSTYMAQLNLGTISLNAMSSAQKLALLQPEMVKQLNAINSLANARDFTNTWGTHLVTRVRTGGMLFVSISSESASNQVRETISSEVKAKYNKVASLEVALSVVNDINRSETTKSVSQILTVLGGDSSKAAVIDPADKATVRAWLASVTADTTFAVIDSIEIFTLVDGTARTMLKKYLDLTMLAFSLNHPAIFATGTGIRAFQTCSVAAPQKAITGFKIIGGGAAATENSNNFLMGSYPQSRNGRPPAAWLAISHDLVVTAAPNDVLTSYAIAIHDPEDYIDITVAQGKGSNTKVGADNAEAMLEDGWILTCGGVLSRTIEGLNKFVTASYFKDAQTWSVASSDYKHAATNAELYAYAVGIKSKEPLLTIEPDKQAGAEERGQHGRPTAIARGFVCGGGVRVILSTGPGNLVQMCWPSTSKVWKAANKDLDSSVSQGLSQAFAISLQAYVKI